MWPIPQVTNDCHRQHYQRDDRRGDHDRRQQRDDGFQTKMRDRLHGILADVIIEAGQTDGMTDWRAWMEMIKEKCGDKVVAMTPVVETVGLLEYDVNKQHMSRFAKVIGIDPAGRNAVGDFSRYLLDPENQKSPSFKLTKDAIEFRADMQKFEADPRKKAEWDNNLPSAIVGYQMAAFRPAGSDVDQLTLGRGCGLESPFPIPAAIKQLVASEWVHRLRSLQE